jgi:chorismate synthase
VTTGGKSNSIAVAGSSHGKCVGITAPGAPGNVTVVYRAFEDGTVESYNPGNETWTKLGK